LARLPLVYVVNTNLDTVEVLQLFFQQSGFNTAGCLSSALKRGEIDLASECERLRPVALVYDVGPPYDREWQFLREVLRSTTCIGVPLIVTTTNEERLRRLVGPNEPILELFTKPYDMELLLDAVMRAARSALLNE
jgi:DNA-binding response OmpR family regulator